MTDHRPGQPPARPSVSGVPVLPEGVHSLEAPHIELLARIATGGGTLTTWEMRKVCAAVVAHLDARRAAR